MSILSSKNLDLFKKYRGNPLVSAWGNAFVALFFVLSFVIFLYFDGIQAAVTLWWHSGTYSYCVLILPIAAFLFWEARGRLASLSPAPVRSGGGLILLWGLAWGLGLVAGVAELVQFAIVGVMQGCILTLLGWRICRRLLIPLAYLWLLVPTGAFLLPGLQSVTAAIAAGLLTLAGIPPFHDGLLIEVSSGHYLVEAGCAGLNFVLAALALGLAFAELVYRRWPRRLLFLVLMIALAVAGNGLRVFLLIAIAHWTGEATALLDDHVLYGWVGFSALILAAMSLGLRFQQARPVVVSSPPSPAPPPVRLREWARASLFCVVLAALVPLALQIRPAAPETGRIHPPVLSCDGQPSLPQDPPAWAEAGSVDARAESLCLVAGAQVHLTLAWLQRPLRQGKLFGLEDRLSAGTAWQRLKRETTMVTIGGQAIPVLALTWGLGSQRRLEWSLRWAGGAWRAAGLATMGADLFADLTGRRDAMLVMVSVDEAGEAAQNALRMALEQAAPEQWVGGDRVTP